MGVLEKVGRSMPACGGARNCASAGGPPPEFFFGFTCSEIDSNAIQAKKCS